MDANTANPGMESESVTKDKLVSDLKTVARDAEELLKATAGDLGDRAKSARDQLTAALENAKATGRQLQEKAMAGAKATDQCIRDHPYPSIGVAFCLGLIIGLLAKRK